MNIKQRTAAALAAATLTATPFTARADVDSLGKTPTYWYTFDGAIVSHGSSALKCAFDDANNTFLTCRGEKKGWRVNPNKSYHHENVFAPNNGSFTIFLSVNPGSGQSNRYIFSLGGTESTTNLAFVLMFNNRIGVVRWDRTRCGANLRAYGLMATDGVAGAPPVADGNREGGEDHAEVAVVVEEVVVVVASTNTYRRQILANFHLALKLGGFYLFVQ